MPDFVEIRKLCLELLLFAKKYRDELNRLMNVVTEKDFEDPGDKVEF